ncbi:MAG TPA: NAD-dependent protein deacylase [Clostridia bacterium]|nr:NAD-dependent protein deacylase [Clostridia bacterium]
MDSDNFINTLSNWIAKSENTVFFGGAGVSTESGVPDFRSPTGIYARLGGAEEYLTLEFMNHHPKEFYAFYREYFMQGGIEPNPAHYKLAEMEQKNKLTAVVTQNVDGLHQKAGSRRVLELHGNGTRFYCQQCGTPYSFDDVAEAEGPFICRKKACGGLVRPDIVMYGESLAGDVLNQSIDAIAKANLVIVGGSSMTVYPAAGLIHYRKKKSRLVLINLDATPYDGVCDLVAHGPIGELLGGLEITSG